MTLGVRIRNADSSLVQIDPLYQNLALKQSGIARTSHFSESPYAPATTGSVTIQSSGCNEPIIIIKCDGVFVGLRSRSQSGTTYTWQLISSVAVVDIQYWIFDTTDVAQMAFNSPFGMRIRSPIDGKIVFDSRYKYMRILSVINTSAGTAEQTYNTPIQSGFGVGFGNASLSTAVAGGPVSGGGGGFFQVEVHVSGFMTTSSGEVKSRLISLISFTNQGTGNPPYTGGIGGSRSAVALVTDIRNY